MDWSSIKHFKPKEFDSPDLPGSGDSMDFGFVKKLDVLRDLCGFPLIVASGYRTPAHNTAVGGLAASAHLTGEAVDIRCLTTQARFLILGNAFSLGFRRVGVGDAFIHLDDSATLDQRVFWLYPPKTAIT